MSIIEEILAFVMQISGIIIRYKFKKKIWKIWFKINENGHSMNKIYTNAIWFTINKLIDKSRFV